VLNEIDPSRLPTYQELLDRKDAPAGSSWGVFGHGDQRGTLNLLTSASALRGSALVRSGVSFGLDHEVGAFAPPVSPNRKAAAHTIYSRHDGRVRDDKLDDFYLQVTSQIDGLRHHRHAVHGFYGGTPDTEIDVDTEALGVQLAGEPGIVGRGVLLDVQRYRQERGTKFDLSTAEPITVDELDEIAAAQGVAFETGDILLIHTGWAEYALGLSDEQKTELSVNRNFCGLVQSRETLAWVWDHRFSIVASDTVAVEMMPSAPTSPFSENVNGMLHPDLIALLGVWLGELWKLGPLAADCARDGVYEMLVTAKPINLVGGVGSPPNAIAVK
jgi:kynurenine formamidase